MFESCPNETQPLELSLIGNRCNCKKDFLLKDIIIFRQCLAIKFLLKHARKRERKGEDK